MDMPFIGQICPFGFNFAPRNWAYCNGAMLPISSNTALFSLLGTNYGGDGRTTFGLPNLNGRTAVGMGQAPGTGLNLPIGFAHGEDQHTMTLAEMPPHSHASTFNPQPGVGSLTASTQEGDSETPSNGAYLAKTSPGASPADQPEKIYRSELGDNPVTLAGVNAAGDGTVIVENAGGGHPFNVVQPSLSVNYCIALEGLYPSRN